MKKFTKVFSILLFVLLLTGCRRVKQIYSSDDLKIEFKSIEKYKVTQDKMFFRTAREEGMIVGPTFKIGIESPTEIKNEKEFNKLMKSHKKDTDFKEVKFSGYKGFLFYTAPYIRYEIYLNIDNKHVLRLNLYSANDKKEFQEAELKSKYVNYILKHMKITVN